MERVHLKELMENKIVVRVNQKDEIRYLFKICSIYSDFVRLYPFTYLTSFNGESYAVYPYNMGDRLSNIEFEVWSNDVIVKCIDFYPIISTIY